GGRGLSQLHRTATPTTKTTSTRMLTGTHANRSYARGGVDRLAARAERSLRLLLRRIRGALLRAVDVLDGVLAVEALVRHQRVTIAEHVRALDLAAIAIGTG